MPAGAAPEDAHTATPTPTQTAPGISTGGVGEVVWSGLPDGVWWPMFARNEAFPFKHRSAPHTAKGLLLARKLSRMQDVWSMLAPLGLEIPVPRRAAIAEAVARHKRSRAEISHADVLAVMCGSPIASWAPSDRGTLPSAVAAAHRIVLPSLPGVLVEVTEATDTAQPRESTPRLLETSDFSAATEDADEAELAGTDSAAGQAQGRLLKLRVVDAKGSEAAAVE